MADQTIAFPSTADEMIQRVRALDQADKDTLFAAITPEVGAVLVKVFGDTAAEAIERAVAIEPAPREPEEAIAASRQSAVQQRMAGSYR